MLPPEHPKDFPMHLCQEGKGKFIMSVISQKFITANSLTYLDVVRVTWAAIQYDIKHYRVRNWNVVSIIVAEEYAGSENVITYYFPLHHNIKNMSINR